MNAFSTEERKILLFSNVGHFLSHAAMLIFPSITLYLTNEFGLPLRQVLKLSFFMYLFYGVGSLPTGFISDRLAPRFSFAIFYLGAGIACIFTGLIKTPTQLRYSLLFVGFFMSMYHPLGIGLISKAVKKRGTALGRNGIFGNIGLAAAPFLAGAISYFSNWRTVYFLLGGLSCVMSVLVLILNIRYTAVSHEKDLLPTENKAPLFILPFVFLCVSLVLGGFVYRGQSLLLPAHFEKNVDFLYNLVRNISFLRQAGTKSLVATTLTSIVYLIGILGHMIGGRVAEKFDLRRAYFVFFLLALPFLTLMYFFQGVLLFIVAIVVIILIIGMQPVENSLLASFVPHKWRSTSFGFKYILTFGIGSLVIYSIDFFQEKYNQEAPFLFLAGILLIVVINNGFLMLVTRKMIRRNSSSHNQQEAKPIS